MTPPPGGEILTLEPLIDAVRAGVEGAGWELSGLQKTTSHQFEGRWDGESTRSAYLFFHHPTGPEWASVDVYLDETTQGLTGNLALVADLVPLARLGTAEAALEALRGAASRHLDDRRRRPLSLRLRLGDPGSEPTAAETEVRFKVGIPRRSIAAGAPTIERLAAETLVAFQRLLDDPELRGLAPADDAPEQGGADPARPGQEPLG